MRGCRRFLGGDLGPIAVCAYIVAFAIPFKWDVPLLVLALSSLVALAFSNGESPGRRSSLVLPVYSFLLASGLSILLSADVVRSARLSVPLLPAALIFFLIIQCFHSIQQLRLLYFTFSLVALGLASAVLWTAWRNTGAVPQSWVSAVGSPALIVPNDSIFFALVAPLSLALLLFQPRSAAGVLAFLSLLSSLCAVYILLSRSAVLTIVASITFTGALIRPRLAFVFGFVIVTAVLLVDAVLGFPLIAKFRATDARLSLWFVGWLMFLDAPFFGHGAHTFGSFYRSYLDNVPRALPIDTTHYIVPWAHNLYVELLAEQGIVGLTTLVLLLASGVWTMWKSIQAAVPDVRILGAGALAAVASFCFSAVFELSFIRQWVVIMLFSLLGVIAQFQVSQMKKGAFQ